MLTSSSPIRTWLLARCLYTKRLPSVPERRLLTVYPVCQVETSPGRVNSDNHRHTAHQILREWRRKRIHKNETSPESHYPLCTRRDMAVTGKSLLSYLSEEALAPS